MPAGARRSTRVTHPKRLQEEYIDDDSSDAESRPSPPKRPKLKANTKGSSTKPVRRGRAGKLSKLPDMPLDVLFEIFGLLHPLDLLRLARTTKSLRAVLTNRCARSVWVQSFASLEDIPECPEDMAEPLYADLAFGTQCQECFSSRAAELIWSWRRRLCKKCVQPVSVPTEQGWSIMDHAAWRGLVEIEGCLNPLLPQALVLSGKYGRTPRVLITDVKRLSSDAERELKAGNDLKQLVEEYLISVAKRQEHAALCEDWENGQIANKIEEREEVRERRRIAIIEKLRNLGWQEELDLYGRFYAGLSQLPAFKPPKDLTDRTWANVQASVVNYMETRKAVRLQEQLALRTTRRYITICDIVSKFARTHHPNDLMPKAVDVCFLPEIKGIWISAPDEEFDIFSAGLLARLPKLSAQCLQLRDSVLQDLIPKNSEPSSADVPAVDGLTKDGVIPDASTTGILNSKSMLPADRFKLATTWYKCTYRSSYEGPLDYTQAHTHQCLFLNRTAKGEHVEALKHTSGFQPWNFSGDGLVFDTVAREMATKLVLACGKDPEVTTMDEMHQLNPRFVLLQPSSVEVVSWRKLVDSSRRGWTTDWRLLNEHELPEYNLLGPQHHQSYWSCLRCWRSGMAVGTLATLMTMKQLGDHLETQHGVVTVTEDDYFVPASRSLDCFDFLRQTLQ